MSLRESKMKAAKQYLGKAGVVATWIGEKVKDGKRTGRRAVVFGVISKRPAEHLKPDERLPEVIDGEVTDVVETGKIVARQVSSELTQRMRPCPGGLSVGHYKITAGTLGAWVKRGASDLWVILSNNHVLANSNDAVLGDSILQPGAYDGGGSADKIAVLTEFARIKFEGEEPGGGKKPKAMWMWRVAKAVPNAIAKAVGCPYRLIVSRPFEVSQPYPNLIDAAIATPVSQADALAEVLEVGLLAGIRDLELGDQVQKVGRTTGHTYGEVIGIEGESLVTYDRDALFTDQLIISPGGFSAGGDSGSAILTMGGFLGGLLFAGSPTITIANRISNVIAILGVRLP